MGSSILTSVKKVCGVAELDTSFDVDLVLHINSVLATLNQLGIGPSEGFAIEDATSLWEDFLDTDTRYNPAKTYVCLRVRLLFDPPSTSYLITAHQDQIRELEWRLNVLREETAWTAPV